MSQTKAQLIAGTPTQDVTFNDATVNSLNGGPLAGNRNRIINGAMEISERGTTFAAVADKTYTLDRWNWEQNGTMVVTISQDSDVPNNTFQNSLKVDVTTADTSIGTGEYAVIRQTIEGYNVRDLIGQTFTLSFWVKSPKTGTHCVSFTNVVPDRSYILQYTVSSANTWEYKTLTVTGGLITAGTWNWTNGRGIDVLFTLATGSTYQTTAGSWNTGNFKGTSGQVNVMDNTANNFYLTGVQLEIGSIATPFERRSYGQELALCQRYYLRKYESVRTTGLTSTGGFVSCSAHSAFPVTMRATPTVTYTYINEQNMASVDAINMGKNGAGFSTSTSSTGGFFNASGSFTDLKFAAEL